MVWLVSLSYWRKETKSEPGAEATAKLSTHDCDEPGAEKHLQR